MAQGTVVVQKYGGSSVADPTRIRKVAERIARTRGAGHQLVVVVSAMGDTTDELLKLARVVTANPPRRELDMLLTAGERIAMALLSMALQELGVEAISFTGSQSGIITNDAHAGARIVEVRPYRIQDELARGRVVIVAGYQGVSYKREITTLGRGGSDTTAVALAAALGAEYCEICSDVDGVYTGDPRIIDDPARLPELTHEEMQVLAESGAKVLHSSAVEYARQQGIVIWARATSSAPDRGGDGTVVRVAGPALQRRVAGVAARDVLLLRAPAGEEGAATLRDVEHFLRDRGAVARWAGWAGPGTPVTALVPTEDVHGVERLSVAAAAALGPEAELLGGLSAVSCVGAGLDADGEVLDTVLRACEALRAPVRHLERTSLRVTVVVEEAHRDALLRALHDAFVPGTAS